MYYTGVKMANTGALRYNEGKLRFDLLPSFALKQIARVFGYGANKYTTEINGDYNWKKGLPWMQTCASLERHLQAWKAGEDYDKESGELHLAHLATNAMFLLEYYKIYPQGDDRNNAPSPKIGLDIDEVLADWVGAWIERFGEDVPESWNFSYLNGSRFSLFTEYELNDFYLSIKPKIKPSDIPFEPHCYITSRSIPVQITKTWLELNKFPTCPVYSVGFGQSKVEVAKESGIDWFVDDSFEHFTELNKAGIACFLMDAPHNRRYDVGFKRIHGLNELLYRQ